MKKLLPLLFATALPMSAFDLPKGFFKVADLDEAQAEACEKPELVAFLITDPKIQPS